MKAYHFLRNDMTAGSGNEPAWTIGEKRTVKGEISLCQSGYHSCKSWLEALQYAPGAMACGDYFFKAEVMVVGAKYPFVGWGRVFKAETTGGKGFKPVEKNPQRMAEKRAEAQALRKAFHIPLPSIEDIGAPDDEPTTRVIDVSTGEVAEKVTDNTPKPVEKPTEASAPVMDTGMLLNSIKHRLKYTTDKAATQWLLQQNEIPQERIDNEPGAVYAEMKEKYHWI